jgi:nitrite reductase/ring-hydroxylating ferredoxin subunit
MAQLDLGDLESFPDGRGTPIEIVGRRLAVFRVGAQVFALDDRCAHRGFPLHDGTIDAHAIRCRTHGACFDLASGAVVRGPARRGVRSYAVTVVDGRVLVEI